MLTATMNHPTSDDECRWQAVLARHSHQDFFYAVTTTGIFCRPDCPAKRPARKNVRFYDDAAAARTAGFRPCRRCRPEQDSLARRHQQLIAAACQTIETTEVAPSLAELAASADMSPHYFHRVFKATVGLTPKAYAAGVRAKRVREALATEAAVTDAIYAAGFQSSGRFYAAAKGLLGMQPDRYRKRGAGERIMFAVGQCQLGAILVAATAKGLCAISLGDDPEILVQALQDQFPAADLVGGDRAFESHVARVVAWINEPQAVLDLPLDVRGTAFQCRVWRALQAIPPGSTRSYGAIAQQIGAPTAARAVAQACGANRLAVAIPCHRVVRQDGSLSGYRWGVARKQQLLAREGVNDER